MWTPHHGDGETLPQPPGAPLTRAVLGPPSPVADLPRAQSQSLFGGCAEPSVCTDPSVPPTSRSCRPLGSPITQAASGARCATSAWTGCPSQWTWRTTSTVSETITRESRRRGAGDPRRVSRLPGKRLSPLPVWVLHSWPFHLQPPHQSVLSGGRRAISVWNPLLDDSAPVVSFLSLPLPAHSVFLVGGGGDTLLAAPPAPVPLLPGAGHLPGVGAWSLCRVLSPAGWRPREQPVLSPSCGSRPGPLSSGPVRLPRVGLVPCMDHEYSVWSWALWGSQLGESPRPRTIRGEGKENPKPSRRS